MAKNHHNNKDDEEMWRYTYPMIGIWVVLLLSVLGTSIPIVLMRRYPNIKILDTAAFRMANGFGAGVIIAVGFVHSFPEAAEGLGEAYPDYPFVGVVAMLGALTTFIAEQGIGLYLGIKHSHGGGEHHTHKHNDEEGGECDESTQWIKFYTEMYSLLFGLTFHSFFVGFALGLQSDDLGLLIAIIAHQFFEAISLGTRVARAKVERNWHIFLIDCIFALAAPIGTAVGMGIQSSITNSPDTYNIVQGCFNGFSAGILIYVGILHLMVEEMERAANNRFHQFLTYIGIAVGATFMAVLAIWA